MAKNLSLHKGEDVWIKSTCFMCWNTCGIKVHRVNGEIVKIEGDPDCPQNWGKICAKGNAGHASLYDPHRVLKPRRRTNPAKGFDVDPGWEEISWDEALEIMTDRLKRIRLEDPRKLVLASFDTRAQSGVFWMAWAAAFGTPNQWGGAANYFCGNGFHPVTYLTHGTWFGEPDIRHCRYLILIGTQNGSVANHLPMDLAARMADARMDGMKLVVVDPVGINAGSKAHEWIPIRPGTDAALALAMIQVLLNEEELYDREFLRKFTNGPYLTRGDGGYLRDAESGKPLVWNQTEKRPLPFDKCDDKAMALEGRFQINGENYPTAFTLLKEHVKHTTPEKASSITTVPAGTIRRLAREFGHAAQIGSTVVMEGTELPLRPAAVSWYRGAIAHKHAMLNGLACQLLNIIIGAIDVPGGHLGSNPLSETAPLHWAPAASEDGLLVPQGYARRRKPPYPPTRIGPPERLDLLELCPVAPYGTTYFTETLLHPERFKLPYAPEMLMISRCNPLMTCANPDAMAEALKRFPFVVSFACELNETAMFADLLLPDAHYLERLDAFPNEPTEFMGAGEGSWYWMVRQPVVPPRGEARPWVEVLYELADRVGFLGDAYMLLNGTLELKEGYAYNPKEKYSWDDLADRWQKSWFGPDKGIEWFKEHGFIVAGKKTVKEAYPRAFITPRIPIYFEYFLEAGKELRKITGEMGIPWDTDDYQALVDWKPCPAYAQTRAGYDLFVVNFKLPFHSLSYTSHNALLAQLSEMDPYAYSVLLNTNTAREKGIRTGDRVRLESEEGYADEGQAWLTDCIHPEVVGIPGCFGRKSKGLARSYGKGVHFNTFLPHSLERIDSLSAALDSCVRVKVSRV
ncbi:MAG: molybdopterin-dependent oxidoreductase [Candidatus Binatia bacterium]|nr:molybdopterin-dependent oxidoreductase [Candidatus Binatia bacterium]